MKLLPENELIWSSVVANSNMNGKRKASGINSYENAFKCKGAKSIHFDLQYKGATDQAGPNYTGQEAVTSVYSVM